MFVRGEKMEKKKKEFEDADKASERWNTCRHSDGKLWCNKLNHNVGVNGYSILFHCGNCPHYKK